MEPARPVVGSTELLAGLLVTTSRSAAAVVSRCAPPSPSPVDAPAAVEVDASEPAPVEAGVVGGGRVWDGLGPANEVPGPDEPEVEVIEVLRSGVVGCCIGAVVDGEVDADGSASAARVVMLAPGACVAGDVGCESHDGDAAAVADPSDDVTAVLVATATSVTLGEVVAGGDDPVMYGGGSE